MTSMRKSHKVLLTGDQTVDWAVVPVNPIGQYNTRSEDERLHVTVNLHWHKGGIFQLKSMINAALANGDIEGDFVHCVDEPREDQLTGHRSGYNYSFAVLEKCKATVRDTGKDDKDSSGPPYRVVEYLGFRRNQDEHDPANRNFTSPPDFRPEVIVIDDAALGFRDAAGNWDDIIPPPGYDGPHPWVIVKMSFNVADGELWERIRERLKDENDWLGDHLIVISSIARLRDRNAEISRNLSWERSVYDTLIEIESRKNLRSLQDCRRLIISFGPSGVLLVQRNPRLQWRLLCNRGLMEGEWAQKYDNGMVFGYGSALCACLTRELIRRPKRPFLSRAARGGIVSMQRLYDYGFDIRGNEFSPHLAKVFTDIEHDPLFEKLSDSDWRTAYDRDSCPSIMGRTPSELSYHRSMLLRVAREGVRALEEELPRVPVANFGQLVTVDRKEIEDFHAVHNLIDNYCGHGKVALDSKPLAIAVFGGPGSGKGYAVNQITERWRKRGIIKRSDFNLSQFTSPTDLAGALHEVRDTALAGQVPLVLWDEFDSPLESEFGWLRFFLAPIQDGKFQQGEVTHLIGPSIFVFAGGTASTFSDFNRNARKWHEKHPDAKATDFLSRIRGYIDIASLDSRPNVHPSPQLMLRRALVLNSLFEKCAVAKNSDGYDVDDGLLHAFLAVPQFRHGVRSIESIMQMSRRRKGQPYGRYSLPSRDQLNLHVDAQKFLELMRSHPDLDSE